MKHQIVQLLLTVPTLATGCVTTPNRPEFEKSTVIETMGDKDAPEWALGDVPMFEEQGNVVFVSVTTMAGNARPEACVKASELSAKADMLRHVKENITASGQVNEISASDDPGYEALSAFLSSGSIFGAKIDSRFWERREESDESGQRVLRLKCSTKVSVKKSELARQLREATGSKGNAEIRQKLLDAQKTFIDGIGADAVAH